MHAILLVIQYAWLHNFKQKSNFILLNFIYKGNKNVDISPSHFTSFLNWDGIFLKTPYFKEFFFLYSLSFSQLNSKLIKQNYKIEFTITKHPENFQIKTNQIRASCFISIFNHAKFFKEILKSLLSSKRDKQLLHNNL